MLHAFYRSRGIEYRYHTKTGKRRKFDKTKFKSYKYWELERCLNNEDCPVDGDSINNLKFLIGLRHEIEHQMTLRLDDYLSGRYQACILNFNKYIKDLFGEKHALDKYLTYSLQFIELSEEQIQGPKPEAEIPQRLRAYIAEYDGALEHEQYNSPNYAYRLLFKRKMVNHPGQADKVIDFIDSKSELAKTIDKEYWVKKEVERKKYRPSDIVKIVQSKGFSRFRINPEHVALWQAEDGKNPGKGYGADVAGVWLWYESWLERVIEICQQSGEKYK